MPWYQQKVTSVTTWLFADPADWKSITRRLSVLVLLPGLLWNFILIMAMTTNLFASLVTISFIALVLVWPIIAISIYAANNPHARAAAKAPWGQQVSET